MEDLDTPYSIEEGVLGYCYKHSGTKQTVYQVVCRSLDNGGHLDYRIKLHEYGHIYLGHLDGSYFDLDYQIYQTIKNNRDEMVAYVNEQCGIDFADKLLDAILSDQSINHMIHNIAMDMEVNSKILSKEDIEDMEKKISEIMMDKQLEKVAAAEEELGEVPDKVKELLEEMRKTQAVKMIVPERYHTQDGEPFPPELTYAEYLIMIIKNLDQFIKMTVSIAIGGNGDTSEVSKEDIEKYLGENGMKALEDAVEGMSDGEGDSSSQGKGGNQGKDHDTPDRGEADQERKDQTSKGKQYTGKSKGNSGETDGKVSESLDPIDMALEEVIQEFKSKVIRRVSTRDMMWNWNRGINRTVIAPSYKSRMVVDSDPTVTFLIDVSGSMDTALVARCLGTIKRRMKQIRGGLKYNIISWSTHLVEHIKDINPKKDSPELRVGGGTSLGEGIKYFRENYGPQSILIIISDLEDTLSEWAKEEEKMKNYQMYAFNYGYRTYSGEFNHIKVKNFNDRQ